MGYFVLPSSFNPSIEGLCDTLSANVGMFDDSGCTYEYLISVFALSYIETMINLAEESRQENGLKPINLNPYCNVHDRVKFIYECINIFKENGYKGISVLYTIKGELELISLQLRKLDPENL